MATKSSVETFYQVNVLATNKKAKETGKSLGGASKIVLSISKEIGLNSNWVEFLTIALSNQKTQKQKKAYELLQEICKPNHKSGSYSAFYILQGLNRGNGKVVELISGKPVAPKAEKLVTGKPVKERNTAPKVA